MYILNAFPMANSCIRVDLTLNLLLKIFLLQILIYKYSLNAEIFIEKLMTVFGTRLDFNI